MIFSLIITTFNEASKLKHTLYSIAQQSHKDFEVIVADDGSKENNVDVVIEFIRRNNFTRPIKVVSQMDKGWRLSGVRNLGSTLATGEYLVFIDGDQLLHPELLSEYEKTIKGRCAAAGVRHYIKNSPAEKEDLLLKNIQIQIYDRRIAEKKIFPGTISYFQVWGCNCLVSRDIWSDIGGFDEGFPGWGDEDIDFFLRVEKSGYPIFGSPNSITYHFPENKPKPPRLGKKYWKDEKRHDISIFRNNGSHVKNVKAINSLIYRHEEG